MDLPDYDRAAHAAEALTTGHRGQHRCTDSVYYGPQDTRTCPVAHAVQTLCDTVDQTRALPHLACHTLGAVEAVAQAMCQHPDGTDVPLTDLDYLQRAWWLRKAQQAMEAHAALLDPDVVTA